MVIDVTDFLDRPYKVPNQDESKDLASAIAKFEKEILISILGYELYTAFITAVAEATEEEPLEQKYKDLKDGAEYEWYGKTYKYEGLKALLKPEIYARWMMAGQYKFANTGWLANRPALAPNGDQLSDTLDADEFRVQYHNEYVKKVGIKNSMVNTFYGFMVANEDIYDLWEFTPPQLTNRLSL